MPAGFGGGGALEFDPDNTQIGTEVGAVGTTVVTYDNPLFIGKTSALLALDARSITFQAAAVVGSRVGFSLYVRLNTINTNVYVADHTVWTKASAGLVIPANGVDAGDTWNPVFFAPILDIAGIASIRLEFGINNSGALFNTMTIDTYLVAVQ